MHEGVISLQNYFFSLNRPIKNGINLFYLIGICAAFGKKSACNMLFCMKGDFILLGGAICWFVLSFQIIKHKEICTIGVSEYGFVP